MLLGLEGVIVVAQDATVPLSVPPNPPSLSGAGRHRVLLYPVVPMPNVVLGRMSNSCAVAIIELYRPMPYWTISCTSSPVSNPAIAYKEYSSGIEDIDVEDKKKGSHNGKRNCRSLSSTGEESDDEFNDVF